MATCPSCRAMRCTRCGFAVTGFIDGDAFVATPDAVKAALARLDGSTGKAVELLTGASSDELDELGGFDGTSSSEMPACECAAKGQPIGELGVVHLADCGWLRWFMPSRHTCPKCGGYVRRWYASSDGDGDVEPRGQCESCEWGF